MTRRTGYLALATIAVLVACACLAVALHRSWHPQELTAWGDLTVLVRYTALAGGAVALALAGERRYIVVPALAIVLPFALGTPTDLQSGSMLDTEETFTNLARAVIEVILVVLPALLVVGVGRVRPPTIAWSPFAWLAGGFALSVVVFSRYLEVDASWHPEIDRSAGAAAAVALTAAALSARPWLLPAAVAMPFLLWSEPVVVKIYESRVPGWIDLSDFYALGVQSLAAGLVVPVVGVLMAGARRARRTEVGTLEA